MHSNFISLQLTWRDSFCTIVRAIHEKDLQYIFVLAHPICSRMKIRKTLLKVLYHEANACAPSLPKKRNGNHWEISVISAALSSSISASPTYLIPRNYHIHSANQFSPFLRYNINPHLVSWGFIQNIWYFITIGEHLLKNIITPFYHKSSN